MAQIDVKFMKGNRETIRKAGSTYKKPKKPKKTAK